MRFCDKCGGLMLPRRSETGNSSLVCRVCGNTVSLEDKTAQTYQIGGKIERKPTSETVIIDESVEIPKTLPKTEAICSKCGYREAFWWMLQMRRADEAPTRFYRCAKCGHVWREYD